MSLQRLLFRISCVIVFATFCLGLFKLNPDQEADIFQYGGLCCLELEELDLSGYQPMIRGVVINNSKNSKSVTCQFFDQQRKPLQTQEAAVSSDGRFTSTISVPSVWQVASVRVELQIPNGPRIVEWSLPAE